MNYTLKEIKDDAYKLMYATEEDIIEYENHICEAINYALIELVSEYIPMKEILTIIQEPSSELGFNKYDMKELASGSEDGTSFMGFVEDCPLMLFVDDIVTSVKDYLIMLDRYLYIKRSISGEFKVFYKKYPAKITPSTPDNFIMQIDTRACPLIALLVAYRILKDDDPVKSTIYFNEYQNAKSLLRSTETFKSPFQIENGGSGVYGI